MSMGLTPQPGDLAAVAIHLPERRDALEALGSLGWRVVEDAGPGK